MSEQLRLGIDTALGTTSIAISKDKTLLCEHINKDRNQQATYLVSWIEECLEQINITYDQLQEICVSIGPGGFTAIRIALATARALGYAAQLPIKGYTTLELMAFSTIQEGHNFPVTTLLPAGRETVFIQYFQNTNLKTKPEILEKDLLKEALQESCPIITTLPQGELSKMHHAIIAHQPEKHAFLLTQIAMQNEWKSHEPSPLYIRLPDAAQQQPFLQQLKSQ